jgi:protein-S-isoprenylcysteine O-methyltransferase Ste14
MTAPAVASGHASAPWVRWFPRVLLVIAMVLLAITLVRQLAHGGEAPYPVAAALTAVYLLWFVAESPVTFRPSAQPAAESGTLVLYGTARVATVVCAVMLGSPWHRWSWWLAVPVLVFAAGLGLRLVAVHVLGRFYSHHVVRRPDHSVVSSGPYRFVRHPAYAGMLLSHLGLVGFFANVASVPLLAVLVAAVVWRIRVEERVLWDMAGYSAYARRRARLLPGVW